jgi:hypothetical protein
MSSSCSSLIDRTELLALVVQTGHQSTLARPRRVIHVEAVERLVNLTVES